MAEAEERLRFNEMFHIDIILMGWLLLFRISDCRFRIFENLHIQNNKDLKLCNPDTFSRSWQLVIKSRNVKHGTLKP